MTTIGRNSSVELLRLVMMVFIVFHHFITQTLDITGFYSTQVTDPATNIGVPLNVFLYCAVNVFILITGFYGIKLSVSKIFNLYIVCAFYGCVMTLIPILWGDTVCVKELIFSTFLPFSHENWWFVTVYLYLCLLSPIINKAIDFSTKNQLTVFLVLLTILNLYFGFYWRKGYNDSGFTIEHFCYLYFIGRYISKFLDVDKIRSKDRILFLCLYFVASSFMAIFAYGSFFWGWSYKNVFNAHVYCHPFLILSAIMLLLYSISKVYHSKIINYLGSSALAIYLIHTSSGVSSQIASIVPIIWHSGCDAPAKWGGVAFYAMFVSMACLLIDKIRGIIMKPLVQKCNKLIGAVDNKIQKYI